MGFLGSIFAAKNEFEAKPLPGSGQYTQQNFSDALNKARNLQLQTNVMPTGQGDETRGQQQAFAQSLQGQAAGTAPSVAGAQLNQAVGAQNQQAATAIGSQRGINPALAARLIAQQQAQNTQGMAGQAVTAGIQERMAAQGLLGNALAQQRQQDIGQAGKQADIGLGLQTARTQAEAVQQQALGQQNQQLIQQNQGVNQINSGVAQQNADSANQWGMGLFKGAMNAASGATGMAGAASGGKVMGQAKVDGDSYENDTVPAMLSPGEIVLPRTVAEDPDKAKEFVENLRKSFQGSNPKKEDASSYQQVVESNKKLEERLKALEHYAYGGMVGKC